MEDYDNPWQYRGKAIEQDDLDGHLAFVYCITNIKAKKAYIGKKLLQKTKTRQVKGKKKRTKVESDWKEYYGSNKELQSDVEKLGTKHFRREVLHLCKTKGTANYLEMREQIDRRVLESDSWYNEQIYVRVHRSHIKL
jgi:hypothetical protein